MQRILEQALIRWQGQGHRMPLLVNGARQVGKTHLVQSFGQKHFKNMLAINFEQQREFIQCFNTLYPEKILTSIKGLSKESVVPGETLLFFDEAQECPKAIMSLRYFKEQLPQQHVIAAGSLLEFTLNQEDFRMPVGRVESIYVKPMSFEEFLIAAGYQELQDAIKATTVHEPLPNVLHTKLLELLHEYFVVGGMPGVVAHYLDHQDIYRTQVEQSSIMTTYRNDFGKYARTAQHKHLQAIFDKVPGLVGQHFKYVDIDPTMQSRELKDALLLLKDAGIIHRVHATAGSGLPLNAHAIEKKFKLLFLDTGLVKAASLLDPALFLNKDLLLVNRGAIAEQFVGQELLSHLPHYQPNELFYWERAVSSSAAEVDYVMNVDEAIIPIEVKAGSTGRLKSLQLFLKEKKGQFGIRISQHPLSFENNVLSIPLYMISELRRIVKEHKH